jgi:peptidoglycan/LPS O-acetylase OafA/YrhL
MAEGAIKPEIEDSLKSESENTTNEKTTSLENKHQVESNVPHTQFIWTPRLIIIFSLTLVLGLSIESLLAQVWVHGYYSGLWVFQVYIICVCLGWLTLLVITHSNWIRIGSTFGIIWALFMTMHIIIYSLNTDLSLRVHPAINAATCIALLGSYICLSIDKTPINRLDAWLFGLAPFIVCFAVALIYFLTPVNERSLTTLENAIASTALIVSLLIWWIRPTLWQSQPGPTFLFGCVPLILLILALSAKEFNPSNYFLAKVLSGPIPSLLTNESNFFFSQVALLFLFLGIMRVIQFERVSSIKE